MLGPLFDDVADSFASTVADLVSQRRVNDPNECCLLLRSTRESAHNAAPYAAALRRHGLTVYNPRNQSFVDQEEVGGSEAVLAIVDPDRRVAQDRANAHSIPQPHETNFRNAYTVLAAANPALANYVARSRTALSNNLGGTFSCNLQELGYYLLSLPPFSQWLNDPVRRSRFSRITKLLEGYDSMPVYDQASQQTRNITRGFMRISDRHPEALTPWLLSFYHLFLTYVVNAGLNDEDDGGICPPGMVPIMTMHQSKGLEFPFVFVGHMTGDGRVGPSHYLETLFSAHPLNPQRRFPQRPEDERADMDLVRQYYVAYSRAEYALILLGTDSQFKKDSTNSMRASCWMGSQPTSQTMSAANLFPVGLVSPRHAPLSRPRFSLTSDIISFRRCRRQYGFFGNDGFVPAQAVQVYFGQMIHQVLDRCHRHSAAFFWAPCKLSPE